MQRTADLGVLPTLCPGECRRKYKVQLNPFTKRDSVTGLGIKQQLPRHLVNVNFGKTCQPISICFPPSMVKKKQDAANGNVVFLGSAEDKTVTLEKTFLCRKEKRISH